jgi:hypothetical protein
VSAAGVPPVLRQVFSERPGWRGFSPRQPSVLMFLDGYAAEPAEELEVAFALPFALEDFEGAT